MTSGRGAGTGGSRAAAARARIAAAERRRRMMLPFGATGAVLVVIVVLIVVKVAGGSDNKTKSGQKPVYATTSPTATGSGSATASSGATAGGVQQVIDDLNGVPAATLNTIKAGTAQTPFKALSGAALTSSGKPEILYIGAEWCPYCAATRWSLAVALGRFGSLSGLGETASSPSDVDANTPTLTFHGSTYTSSYLSFVPREVQSNQAAKSGNGYATLDVLTSAQNTLWQAAGGGYPYINIGGKYLVQGAPYDPQLLAGMSHAAIANALKDPNSAVAKAIDGGANAITAAICKATGGKPGAVCSSAAVTSTPIKTVSG